MAELKNHTAFSELYNPTDFPVFCDHSVLDTDVDGIGIVRVCNGMELSNPKKGFNLGLPVDKLGEEDFINALKDYQSWIFSEDGPLVAALNELGSLKNEGVNLVDEGVINTAIDESEKISQEISGGNNATENINNFVKNYLKNGSEFGANFKEIKNGNGEAVKLVALEGKMQPVLDAFLEKTKSGDGTSSGGVGASSNVASDVGNTVSEITVSTSDNETSGGGDKKFFNCKQISNLKDVLNKKENLKIDDNKIINNYLNKGRLDKLLIMMGEIFKVQSFGGFERPNNTYDDPEDDDKLNDTLIYLTKPLINGNPSIVIMVEGLEITGELSSDSEYTIVHKKTDDKTPVTILHKKDLDVNINDDTGVHNTYIIEVKSKKTKKEIKILSVHSAKDFNKDSIVSFLKDKKENFDIVCGDFNLTKSKTKSNNDPNAEYQINDETKIQYPPLKTKVFPNWEIKKKRAEMNILLNNQIHKGGTVQEMDGMAIFVNNPPTDTSENTPILADHFGLKHYDPNVNVSNKPKPYITGTGKDQKVIIGGGNRKRTRKNRVKRTRKGSRNYRKPARRTKRNKRSVKSRRRRSR